MTKTRFQCLSCKFFALNVDYGPAPENGSYGDCRRNSPSVDNSADEHFGSALWPIVAHSDFCGDGRKREFISDPEPISHFD